MQLHRNSTRPTRVLGEKYGALLAEKSRLDGIHAKLCLDEATLDREVGMLDLPNELLIQIFEFVESVFDPYASRAITKYNMDIANIQKVCRRFRQCSSTLLFRTITVACEDSSISHLETISNHPIFRADVRTVRVRPRFRDATRAERLGIEHAILKVGSAIRYYRNHNLMHQPQSLSGVDDTIAEIARERFATAQRSMEHWRSSHNTTATGIPVTSGRISAALGNEKFGCLILEVYGEYKKVFEPDQVATVASDRIRAALEKIPAAALEVDDMGKRVKLPAFNLKLAASVKGGPAYLSDISLYMGQIFSIPTIRRVNIREEAKSLLFAVGEFVC